VRESILRAKVSDAGNDAFHIFNATSADSRFSPGFSGSVFSNSGARSLEFIGQTVAANDSGTTPLVSIMGRITDSQTDPNNGSQSGVITRPILEIRNNTTNIAQFQSNGNVLIGTTTDPGTGKLHVAGTFSTTGASTFGAVTLSPAASATPASNGQLTFEATSNTSLTIKMRGTDGTVRSVVLTLS